MTALDRELALSPYPAVDIQDGMAFFGLSAEDVMARMGESWHRVERLWNDAHPQADAGRQQWYATTDAHIFEGLAWHAQPEQRQYREAIAARCTGRVLDWGAGVGTEGLMAMRRGCDVTFVELGLMLDFVRMRAIREHRGHGTFLTPQHCRALLTEKPDLQFDTIICLDMLEHLDEPESLLADFRRWLTPDGLFIGSAPFDALQYVGHLPQHRGKRLSVLCEQAGIINYWIDPIRPGDTDV